LRQCQLVGQERPLSVDDEEIINQPLLRLCLKIPVNGGEWTGGTAEVVNQIGMTINH